MNRAPQPPAAEPNTVPRARLEMVDVRGDEPRLTGHGAIFDTDAETLAAFHNAKPLEVPKERGEFVIDNYDTNGDLVDSILIDAAGFTAVLGESPREPEYYALYDQTYCSSRHQDPYRKHAEAAAVAEAALANRARA